MTQINNADTGSVLACWRRYAADLQQLTWAAASSSLASMGEDWTRAWVTHSCDVMTDATEDLSVALAEHCEVQRRMEESGHAMPVALLLAGFVAEYGPQD